MDDTISRHTQTRHPGIMRLCRTYSCIFCCLVLYRFFSSSLFRCWWYAVLLFLFWALCCYPMRCSLCSNHNTSQHKVCIRHNNNKWYRPWYRIQNCNMYAMSTHLSASLKYVHIHITHLYRLPYPVPEQEHRYGRKRRWNNAATALLSFTRSTQTHRSMQINTKSQRESASEPERERDEEEDFVAPFTKDIDDVRHKHAVAAATTLFGPFTVSQFSSKRSKSAKCKSVKLNNIFSFRISHYTINVTHSFASLHKYYNNNVRWNGLMLARARSRSPTRFKIII